MFCLLQGLQGCCSSGDHSVQMWVSQPCRSSLAALAARTSLDLELDLQASRTRQRQLTEELCDLRELRQRLEDAQLRGHAEPPAWLLRDERFRSLLREAERQVRPRPANAGRGQAAGPGVGASA